MISLSRRAAAVPLLLLPVLGLAAPASADHPPESEAVYTGTITGTDGRAVNALLGFDWQNAQGRRIDRHGCVQSPQCPLPGYATVVRVNPTLLATGSSDTSTATTSWEVKAPPGAAQVFLEVYPQNERFRTDEARYGHAMRHSVQLPLAGPLPIQLPVTDCADGGTVGSVRGTATLGGQPFPLRRVVAWSLEPFDALTRPVLGWNIGTALPDGTFVVPNLVPDQRYQVWVTAADGQVRKQFGVRVNTCAETPLPLSFDPPPVPVDPPPAPAPAPVPPPPAPTLVRPVVLAGQPALVDGGAEPGTVVELLAEAADGSFRTIRTTTVAPSGYYSFTVFPTARTPLKVRVKGQESAPTVLQVRSQVSMAVARTAPLTYRFTGAVSSRRAEPVDLLLRTADGRTRRLATATTGPDGRYSFPRRFAAPGTFDLSVATRQSTDLVAGSSAVRRTAVR